MSRIRPLVVIGGGPAGTAAAVEAARAGLPPTLIDEAPHVGGQIYRALPDEFHVRDASGLGRDFARGEALRAELTEVMEQIELLSETTVAGVWPNHEVLWTQRTASGVLRAERLIIASGAYERPSPFPGWTLPGVMNAGGVQTLLKTMRIRPGRRALVAGTGPLILSTAYRLHAIGVEIAAVLEVGDHGWLQETGGRSAGEWELVNDARNNLAGLNRANIPVLLHHTVFSAEGTHDVQAATYGRVDPGTWQPDRSERKRVDVDLVVTGFGFVPNTEVTMLAGCIHDYRPELGGWIPRRDACMQTSVPGVFAAGDGAGIGGVAIAVEEGRIAGITAAEQAGAISEDEAAKRRTASLERLESLSEMRSVLGEAFRIRDRLLDLATPETVACRCEEISFAEVHAALQQGAKDLNTLKLLTRLGMGACQGRNCGPQAGMFLCQATGRKPAEIGRINPRPPVKPITLGALASMKDVSQSTAVDPLDAVGGGAS